MGSENAVVELVSVKPGDAKPICSVCGHRGNGIICSETEPVSLVFDKCTFSKKGTIRFRVLLEDGIERVKKGKEWDADEFSVRHSVCLRCLSTALFEEATRRDTLDDYEDICDTPPEVVEASFCIGKKKECTLAFLEGFQAPADIVVFDPKTYENKKWSDLHPEEAAKATKKFEEAKTNLIKAAEENEANEASKRVIESLCRVEEAHEDALFDDELYQRCGRAPANWNPVPVDARNKAVFVDEKTKIPMYEIYEADVPLNEDGSPKL